MIGPLELISGKNITHGYGFTEQMKGRREGEKGRRGEGVKG
jgi:hypothetical protein